MSNNSNGHSPQGQAEVNLKTTPYITLQTVDEKDLEDGHISLELSNGLVNDNELVAFIEKYTSTTVGFHDFYLSTLRDVFSNGGTGGGESLAITCF
jgi:hypothetical protein